MEYKNNFKSDLIQISIFFPEKIYIPKLQKNMPSIENCLKPKSKFWSTKNLPK